MNILLEPDDVVAVISSFLTCNEGDDATQGLILSIGCELLDVSEDMLLDMIDSYKE